MHDKDIAALCRDYDRLEECRISPDEPPMTETDAIEVLIHHLACEPTLCPRKCAAIEISNGHDEPTGGMAKVIQFPRRHEED